MERKLLRKFDENTGALTKKSKTTWEYEIKVKNIQKAGDRPGGGRPAAGIPERADRGEGPGPAVLEGYGRPPQDRERDFRVDPEAGPGKGSRSCPWPSAWSIRGERRSWAWNSVKGRLQRP
ncbi:MAG: DUF4139 domain-containing protein [Candidatus Moduliflexus flocculans]|nr:DUF4139 domain-containing protein [Candidatus Moduliflexus flocculans]